MSRQHRPRQLTAGYRRRQTRWNCKGRKRTSTWGPPPRSGVQMQTDAFEFQRSQAYINRIIVVLASEKNFLANMCLTLFLVAPSTTFLSWRGSNELYEDEAEIPDLVMSYSISWHKLTLLVFGYM